jgi:hypothetical protein
MAMLNRTNRFYDTSRFGQPQIRVFHRKGKRKQSPRYLLKCGCCSEKVEIFYSEDGLEINGVNGTIEDWREILLPLLRIEYNESRLIDLSKKGKTGSSAEIVSDEESES